MNKQTSDHQDVISTAWREVFKMLTDSIESEPEPARSALSSDSHRRSESKRLFPQR